VAGRTRPEVVRTARDEAEGRPRDPGRNWDMTKNLRLLLSGLFLSSAAVGVACGGSSSASNTEPANGDAAYVDSVCSAAGTMFAAHQKDFASSSAALIGMDPT